MTASEQGGDGFCGERIKNRTINMKKTVLYKETWKLMSKYVCLRDKACVTCGSKLTPQAGHFIHGKCMDFVFNNINRQCARCNHYLSGNLAWYADYLIDTHGYKIIKTLIRTLTRRRGKDYSVAELTRLYNRLTKKIKELKK